MNCEEIRELLPAYALDLLEGEEREAVEAHLRAGREHDAELVELRATGFALELLRDDAQHAAALRERIRGITEMGGVSEGEAPFSTLPREGEGAGGAAASRRAGGRPRWWLQAAAVLALFVMFGAGWLAHAAFEGGSGGAGQYSYVLQGAGGEYVSFSAAEGSERVTVTMEGLDRLEDGRRYRLWAIRDGDWQLIGQCNTNEQGGWVGDFVFALEGDEELAVTVEAPSEDPQPPGTPILSTQS